MNIFADFETCLADRLHDEIQRIPGTTQIRCKPALVSHIGVVSRLRQTGLQRVKNFSAPTWPLRTGFRRQPA